jgi:hypothetical protein
MLYNKGMYQSVDRGRWMLLNLSRAAPLGDHLVFLHNVPDHQKGIEYKAFSWQRGRDRRIPGCLARIEY